MKQTSFKRFMYLVVMLSIVFIVSCDDEWSNHYDESTFDLPDKTIKETIEAKPELSIFYKMLKMTGFTTNLDASQSFTVWVPTNDALSDIDTTNKSKVQEIVLNHITRNQHTTSGKEDLLIRMLNGKYVSFVNDGGSYRFGDIGITETNVVASNGFIHILDGYAPYNYNIWEYIDQAEGLDSLRNYLYNQNTKIFDAENSIEVGVDTLGQAVYDSVFRNENKVLSRIGSLAVEDTLYTVVMPNNTAWNEAYNRIKKYYNFADDAAEGNRQDKLTKWTLVKDMVFEDRIIDPASHDSLLSTTGTVFYNPAAIFSNTQQYDLSNGIFHVTNQMPYKDTASWFKEIRVEAEVGEGRTNSSNNIFNRTSFGTGFDVSDNEYILVDPLSNKSSVEFLIPGTLSAKYNIYCVFVPAYIVDKTNLTPSKVKFTLTYIRRQSGSTFIKEYIPENNITNVFGTTKMFIDQFSFDYANVVDEDFNRIAVKLKVESDVTIEEELSGAYSRTMRIDAIILEPVLE